MGASHERSNSIKAIFNADSMDHGNHCRAIAGILHSAAESWKDVDIEEFKKPPRACNSTKVPGLSSLEK